jgi:SET domain
MLDIPLQEYLQVASIFIKIQRIIKTRFKIMQQFPAHYNNPGEEIPKKQLMGECFFLASDLVNHSCDANMYEVTCGTSVVIRAMRPILKGEQLTTFYLDMPAAKYKYDIRQAALLGCFNFKCR